MADTCIGAWQEEVGRNKEKGGDDQDTVMTQELRLPDKNPTNTAWQLAQIAN